MAPVTANVQADNARVKEDEMWKAAFSEEGTPKKQC